MKNKKNIIIGVATLIIAIGIYRAVTKHTWSTGLAPHHVQRAKEEPIIMTKEWSGVIPMSDLTVKTAGFHAKRKDVTYIVEYIGTDEYGTVQEEIPSRSNRPKNWRSKYPNIAVEGYRFRLPDNSSLEEAELVFEFVPK